MVKRLFAMKRGRRGLLLEAAGSLLLAKIMLRFLPFPRLESSFSLRPRGPEKLGQERERLCHEVRSAVERVAEFAPKWMVCFPRAIAVQAMLRRRGVSTTIVYGAQEDGHLTAHVWVQDGERDVIGMPAKGEFTVVATYSPSMQS